MKYVVDITEDGDYIVADDRGVVRAFERLCTWFLINAYRLGLYRVAGIKRDKTRGNKLFENKTL